MNGYEEDIRCTMHPIANDTSIFLFYLFFFLLIHVSQKQARN